MDLRLIVITDAEIARPRTIEDVVRAAVMAGAPAVQLRDKRATAREIFEQAVRLRAITSAHGALLFVNDRLDVALCAGANGVHIGPDDMPIAAARKAVPASFVIGTSTDDPRIAQAAEAAGADYIGCGAVFGTTSKAVGDEKIGPRGVQLVASAVTIPVVGIGGIDSDNVQQIADAGAAGAAVIRAVMAAEDVGAVVRRLMAPFMGMDSARVLR